MTSVCISHVIRYKTDTHVFAINKIAINYKYFSFLLYRSLFYTTFVLLSRHYYV